MTVEVTRESETTPGIATVNPNVDRTLSQAPVVARNLAKAALGLLFMAGFVDVGSNAVHDVAAIVPHPTRWSHPQDYLRWDNASAIHDFNKVTHKV